MTGCQKIKKKKLKETKRFELRAKMRTKSDNELAEL